MLHHCFPRPKRRTSSTVDVENQDARACAVLTSILDAGLLCAPEYLNIHANRHTTNEDKIHLLRVGEPEIRFPQSRLCFTLCSEEELYQPVVRGIEPGEAGPVGGDQTPRSHADLFGPYAVCLDPIMARRIGIVPTFYFSPNDMFGSRFQTAGSQVPGLNLQVIQSLKELRELLILLALIERSVPLPNGGKLPPLELLRARGLHAPFEKKLEQRISDLALDKRREVFELFDNDRSAALGLIDFVEMMLSLFQETDSTIDGRALAFYQEREWRLVFHHRKGMVWFPLIDQPHLPISPRGRTEQINAIRLLLGYRDPDYLKHCWVLEAVDGQPIREIISKIIVPCRALPKVRTLMARKAGNVPIVAAEEYGYVTPIVPD